MKLLIKISPGIIGIALFITTSGMTIFDSYANAAPPDSAPVTVINTPLPVSGTVGVSGPVVVSGTVGVTQSGALTVGINPSENAVTVRNTQNTPLSIRSVDNPADRVWHLSGELDLMQGFINSQLDIDPGLLPGQRFVIEYISGEITLHAGAGLNKFDAGDILVSTSNGYHWFPVNNLFNLNAAEIGLGILSQQTRMYNDAGNHINITIQRMTGNSVGSANISLTGYIINLPNNN